MLLFVGLGNPGAKLRRQPPQHRLHGGDAIAKRHGFAPWRRRFQGVATEGPLGGERVLLLLPGTYMNESGRAVAEALHFYKLALADIVVFHDELELPPGKVRVKTGGGIAGHNGLRSITRACRQRLPPGAASASAIRASRNWCTRTCSTTSPRASVPGSRRCADIIADNAELLARGQDASFQNKVHLAMDAKGFGQPDDKTTD